MLFEYLELRGAGFSSDYVMQYMGNRDRGGGDRSVLPLGQVRGILRDRVEEVTYEPEFLRKYRVGEFAGTVKRFLVVDGEMCLRMTYFMFDGMPIRGRCVYLPSLLFSAENRTWIADVEMRVEMRYRNSKDSLKNPSLYYESFRGCLRMNKRG